MCAGLLALTQGYLHDWQEVAYDQRRESNPICLSSDPCLVGTVALSMATPSLLPTHPALALTATHFASTESSHPLKIFPCFPSVPEGICVHTLQLNSTRDGRSRTIHPANDFYWHTMAIHYRSGSVCPLFLIPAASKNNQKHPVCLTASQHNRR